MQGIKQQGHSEYLYASGSELVIHELKKNVKKPIDSFLD